MPNSGAEPPIKNPHPFIAARGEAAQNQLCGLANYQIDFTPEQLKKLYKDKKDVSGESAALPEWQCQPHSADYIWRGPSPLKISKEVDPVSREIGGVSRRMAAIGRSARVP